MDAVPMTPSEAVAELWHLHCFLVLVTGNKFIADVVVTSDKVITGVVVTGDKLFTGINDTGDH